MTTSSQAAIRESLLEEKIDGAEHAGYRNGLRRAIEITKRHRAQLTNGGAINACKSIENQLQSELKKGPTMGDPNVICSRPECQTTAGCQCSQRAQAAQPFQLRRRRDSVTAQEIVNWIRKQPDAKMMAATLSDIDEAMDEICGPADGSIIGNFNER